MKINSLEHLLADGLTPKDWDEDKGFRGISRNTVNRRYAVRLSVLGSQFTVASEASQLKAARAYDIALWKLAAFISRTLKPNFSESFDDITQAMVDEQYPRLNDLYAECATAARLDDALTEREHREAALAAPRQTALVPQGSAHTYSRYQKLVNKTRSDAMLIMVRCSQLRMALDFLKLPELQRVAGEYEQLLGQAEQKGGELQKLLTGHADLYKKLFDNK